MFWYGKLLCGGNEQDNLLSRKKKSLSDELVISPQNVPTLSTEQVIRILKLIKFKLLS